MTLQKQYSHWNKRIDDIKIHYGFDSIYDLSNELIRAYERYNRAAIQPRPPKAAQISERLRAIRQQGTLDGATIRDLIELSSAGVRFESKHFNDPRKVKQAATAALKAHQTLKRERGPHKLGGRITDHAKATLARTLALIYYRGTRKLPYSRIGKSERRRGPFMSFANQVMDLIGVRIPPSTVSSHMLNVRQAIAAVRKRCRAPTTRCNK